MAKFARASIGAGLFALSLVTGLAANADASTEVSAQHLTVSSNAGGVLPNRQSYAALNVAVGAVGALLSTEVAAVGLELAFIGAEYLAGDSLPKAGKKISDADYQKAADANFDSAGAAAG